MDLDDLRSILRESGVNVWSLIESAITLAYRDCSVSEIRQRRDRVVERLYVPPVEVEDFNNNSNRVGDGGGGEIVKEKDSFGVAHNDDDDAAVQGSPLTPKWIRNNEEEQHHDEDDDDKYNHDRTSVDDVQMRILDIKELLEDRRQSDDDLLNLLHELDDMDIKFQVLKETDIGRHVNLQRKHPSNEVRQIVKQLVRKWKCTVDDWVKHNSIGEAEPSSFTADGHSPQQNLAGNTQKTRHQVSDFNQSPSSNNQNGSYGSDKNNSEPEPKRKMAPKRELQTQRSQSPQVSSSPALADKQKEQKNNIMDAERLASARKRLHDNYQEAQNAKKQRTIQVMDLHDIPKPKNSFFSKNKGGSQAKHW